MKVHLEGITVVNVPIEGKIVVNIIADNTPMQTALVMLQGGTATFPDIFEFIIDELLYVMGEYEVNVAIYSKTNLQAPACTGKAFMHQLIKKFNKETTFSFPLLTASGQDGGEMRIKGIITEAETAINPLKEQHLEYLKAKKSYDEIREACKVMEREASEALSAAQDEFTKLSKKHNTLIQKYAELQDLLNRKTALLDTADERIEKERSECDQKLKQQEEVVINLQNSKEDLRKKVSDLTNENQSLNNKLLNSIDDSQNLKAELDNLYASKLSSEQKMSDKIEELMKENQRLRQEIEDSAYMQESSDLQELIELQDKIRFLNLEIERLRAAAVSKSIHFHNNFINNINVYNEIVNKEYIDTIVKNMNSTKVYITNTVQSEDLLNVKREFIDQLKRYDEMRRRNVKLLDRVHNISHNIQVCARTRPPDEEEVAKGNLIIDNVTLGSGEFNIYDFQENKWNRYEFDHHWAYDAVQVDVFEDIEPLIASIVPNITELSQTNLLNESVKHVNIMSFGGKSSGKTFTMHGFGSYLGLSYRSVQRIFEFLDFQNLFLQQQKKIPIKEGEVALMDEMFYKYSVTLSMMEVFEDKMYDILVTDKNHAKNNLAKNVIFDAESNQIQVEGLQYHEVKDVSEALSVLAKSIHNAYTRDELVSREHNTSFIVEIGINVQYHPDEAVVRSKLYLTEIASSDAEQRDTNANKLQELFQAMVKGQNGKDLPYGSSPLTSLLRTAISYDARMMMIFNFSPTDLTIATTKADVDFAMEVRTIKRDPSTSKHSQDQVELRMVELKMKTVTTELREQKKRNIIIQESLTQTKSVAEVMIVKFNDRNKLILKHYLEEKQISKQLQLDLELTHRNLKRSIIELHEQRTVNERLIQILKMFEKERQAANNE